MNKKKSISLNNLLKTILLILSFGFIGFFMFGCSSSQGISDSSAGTNKEMSVSDDTSVSETNDSDTVDNSNTISENFDSSKIIYTGQAYLYVEDYQKAMTEIEDYIKSIGGFIENLNSTTIDTNSNSVVNEGYMTIRVPKDKFDDFKKKLDDFGNVTNISVNATNISQEYQDVQGQLESLRIQEDRLLEYLNKATNIQEMLEIEQELNRVRTEIESRVSMIENWDQNVAYSTFTLTITESKLESVSIDSPFTDIGNKVKNSFSTSVNILMNIISGLIVVFFFLLPYLIILGIIVLIVWIIVKIVKKKQLALEENHEEIEVNKKE